MFKDFDLDLKIKYNVDFVAGFDEAGRGALCGPFTAACVILPNNYFNPGINDSKQLNESQREAFEIEIKENALFYHIVSYDNKEIDALGIQSVNIAAFETLKAAAESKYENILCLVDGNIMESRVGFRSLIKGDSISFSIACASILAKTHRDRIMINLSKEYTKWNLEVNKGYGVDYINHVKQHGFPNKIHRYSYKIKNDKQIKLF